MEPSAACRQIRYLIRILKPNSKRNENRMSPHTYDSDATAMIVGVGLMGQHMARNAPFWLGLKKLVLVLSLIHI